MIITEAIEELHGDHLPSHLLPAAMRPSSTGSSTSGDAKTKPLQPPPRPALFQSTASRLLLLVASPFVVILLLIWWLLGVLFGLPAVAVAATSVVTTWTLYLSMPGIPTGLLDWPIVFTVGYAVIVFAKSTPKIVPLGVTAALFVYAIVRNVVYDAPDDSTRSLLTALTVLGCILPLWVTVCQLKLWLPADEKALEEVEKKIYRKYIVTDHTTDVVAGLGTVHVPYCGDSSRLPPRTLVLVHGYAAGNGFWAANLQTLAKFFNVYAVEWKGIGRSIRPKFRAKTDQEKDAFFVESLEEWRRVMQLDRFILCAHSMGAIYSSFYVEKYPQHVEHLILVSPAGVASSGKSDSELFWAVQLAAKYRITPMSLIRFCGPFGLSLMQWILRRRIEWVPEGNIIRSGDIDFDDISTYCYHNWALKPSGDIAVYTHLHPGATAPRRPLDEIFTPEKTQVPLTFLFGGGGDWMPSDRAQMIVRTLEKTHYAVFRLVPAAGHQVFMDNPSDFNQILINAVHEHEHAVANGTATSYHQHY